MENKPGDPSEEIIDPDTDTLESTASSGRVINSAPSEPPKPKPDKKPRMSFGGNRFLLAFVILLIISSVLTFLALRSAKKPASNSPSAASLTSQQLADISGSTTVVGDSQQTLDVQSNSVFEGSVLLRNNLNVAGTIKVGGGLSLPSVTVGGVSSFGQAQINGTLSVAGDTNLQGQVTLEKSLSVSGNGSFGSLSAGTLTVSSLQLIGDLTLSRHLAFNGGTPSRSNGAGLGSGGTASINGSDIGGTVTINTGGSPSAGCMVNIGFVKAFNSTPRVILSPASAAAGGLSYYATRTTTGFSICTASAPASGSNYVFDYIVFD